MTPPTITPRRSPLEVFLAFLRLGCTSFGGPVAHLGYFQREFVERRGWITPEAYAELVALAQSLPGPASSQVGYGIGVLSAGLPGGLAAWLGFTTPSALLMLGLALSGRELQGPHAHAALHGLQLVAVAVVAQAVLAMQQKLAPDARRLAVAALAAGIILWLPDWPGTMAVLALGALAGRWVRPAHEAPPAADAGLRPLSRRTGWAALTGFLVLLGAALAGLRGTLTAGTLAAAFYRTGALVFGGGHVVLPLLQSAVVRRGWLNPDTFLAGYGAAQALPGPLFTLAAYLGASVQPAAHPLLFGLLALAGIFLPGILLMTAALPFWGEIRARSSLRSALTGINAAMVGVLFAALVRPVLPETVHSARDLLGAAVAFGLLLRTRIPVWAVVLAAGALGYAISLPR